MHKICQKCQQSNGVRTKNCCKCGTGFTIQGVKQPDLIPSTETTIKSSITQLVNRKLLKNTTIDWRVLKRGDVFKVTGGGGRWKLLSGEIEFLGYKGIFKVSNIQNDGILAYPVKATRESGACFIYCGPKKILKSGTILCPHKIVGIKQKVLS
jgi:hypothetical protein